MAQRCLWHWDPHSTEILHHETSWHGNPIAWRHYRDPHGMGTPWHKDLHGIGIPWHKEPHCAETTMTQEPPWHWNPHSTEILRHEDSTAWGISWHRDPHSMGTPVAQGSLWYIAQGSLWHKDSHGIEIPMAWKFHGMCTPWHEDPCGTEMLMDTASRGPTRRRDSLGKSHLILHNTQETQQNVGNQACSIVRGSALPMLGWGDPRIQE